MILYTQLTVYVGLESEFSGKAWGGGMQLMFISLDPLESARNPCWQRSNGPRRLGGYSNGKLVLSAGMALVAAGGGSTVPGSSIGG